MADGAAGVIGAELELSQTATAIVMYIVDNLAITLPALSKI
jgi:hypothetical protein